MLTPGHRSITTLAATSALYLDTSFCLSMITIRADLPEQKLPVEICHINFVEINDSDIFDSWQREVFKEFAAEPPSANNKHLGVFG